MRFATDALTFSSEEVIPTTNSAAIKPSRVLGFRLCYCGVANKELSTVMGIFHGDGVEIEIPSFVEDDDGEFMKVDTMEDMELLVKAMGYDSILHFESHTGIESEKLLRRWWYYGARDRIFVREQAEAINETTAGEHGIKRILVDLDKVMFMAKGEPLGVQLYGVAQHIIQFLGTIQKERGITITPEQFAQALNKINEENKQKRDENDPDMNTKH